MSEQQATASITVSAAIRQALESGCETNAAILSSVQAATGKIPSPSAISQIRKKLGKPANSGRGRPLKSAVKAIPVTPVQAVTKSQARRHKFQKNPNATQQAKERAVTRCFQVLSQPAVGPAIALSELLSDVTAQDFIEISKFLKPHVSKYGLEKVVHVVNAGCSM